MAEEKQRLIYPRFEPGFSDPSSLERTVAELRNFDAAVVSYVVSLEEVKAEQLEQSDAVRRAVILLVALLLFGAFYFGNMCEWEWYTAVYFSWVTLSTIGYGDYTPVNRCGGNSYASLERSVRSSQHLHACLSANPGNQQRDVCGWRCVHVSLVVSSAHGCSLTATVRICCCCEIVLPAVLLRPRQAGDCSGVDCMDARRPRLDFVRAGDLVAAGRICAQDEPEAPGQQ
jgi:hypothetical protein